MKTFSTLILLLFSCSLFAQSLDIRNHQVSFSIGVAELNNQISPNGDQLDFLNYLDYYPDYLDFLTVKFGYKCDFLEQMSLDAKLILMDDLVPDNYDISISYFLNKHWGIGVGSMLNNNYISGFQVHQQDILPDYYLMDENYQQFKAYDLGFYVSPTLKLVDGEWFKAFVKCDLGFSSFLGEQTVFCHKKKLSNERLQYHYDTKMTFQPYVEPKVELNLQAFKIKGSSVGLLLRSSYYYANKSMNYTLTQQKWVSENKTSQEIVAPKHNYSRFELDGGVYVRW